MKLRILSVPFDPELGRFDDQPLCGFLADKELLGVRDHFLVHEGQPHLAVVLAYRPVTAAAQPAARAKKQARRESWRELIEQGDMPLFNTLREWRARRSKEEGIPPYVICTNHQLAQVVRARPRTVHKLGEIEGFGSSKHHAKRHAARD